MLVLRSVFTDRPRTSSEGRGASGMRLKAAMAKILLE